MKLRRGANLLKILFAQNKCSSHLLDNSKIYFSTSNGSFPLIKKECWDAASSLLRKCYLEKTLLNYTSAFTQWKLSTLPITFLNLVIKCALKISPSKSLKHLDSNWIMPHLAKWESPVWFQFVQLYISLQEFIHWKNFQSLS